MKQGTLEKIQNLAVSLQLVTVEDMRKHSLPQLVTMIANKLNELMNEVHCFETDVIEMVETQNENIQYLLGEGLHLEVATVFEGWLEDGTFDTLINQSALNQVINRIEEINNNHLRVSVKTFGAIGDGVTNDTLSIEQCLNYCIENGKTCYFPSGHYMIDRGFKFADSWEDENSNRLISIEGESYHNTIIDLMDGIVLNNWNVFDFSFNKKVVCKNISSNLGFNIIDPQVYWKGEVEWRKALREKDFYLENCVVHGSNVQQGYYHYINSPAPESYDRYSEATYTRYPLEITNGSGYNAININNFATNKDGSIASPQDNSAIGIVDAVTNSTGTIFIDMMGEGRSFERYISRTAQISSNVRPQTVWEVHRNGHLAIGCSVDESEFGWNTIKMRDRSPSIRMIDANNDDSSFDIGVLHESWGDEIYFKRGNIGVKFWIDEINEVHLLGITGGIDGGITINQDTAANWDSCLKIKRSDNNKSFGIGLDDTNCIRRYFDDGGANLYQNGRQGNLFLLNSNGTSNDRPNYLINSWTDIGFLYFDTTLNKPIWWNGEQWVDSMGNVV